MSKNWPITSSLFAFAVLAAATGCSNDSTPPAGCTIEAGGSVQASNRASSCGTLSPSTDPDLAGDYLLGFDTSFGSLSNLSIALDLGPTPTPGSFSSESASSWSAEGVSADSCTFSAGSDAVPTGSFTLQLTSVNVVSLDDAHGKLDLLMAVQAPPATDCGASDTEEVVIDF